MTVVKLFLVSFKKRVHFVLFSQYLLYKTSFTIGGFETTDFEITQVACISDELNHKKTNNVVSEQVRHKPGLYKHRRWLEAGSIEFRK